MADPAPQVRPYDTTLRDGTQREGLSSSGDDKLRMTQELDALALPLLREREGGLDAGATVGPVTPEETNLLTTIEA